jgi:hypothetical protein
MQQVVVEVCIKTVALVVLEALLEWVDLAHPLTEQIYLVLPQ